MRGAAKLCAVIPGGSSTPVMAADEIDVPYANDPMSSSPKIRPVEVRPGQLFDIGGGRQLRSMPGSGAIVVMEDGTDVVAVAARLMRFYAHESCGQCTPCREGTGWLAQVCNRVALGNGHAGDIELLASVANGIAGNTICPLGDAAAWPMLGFLTKFRKDFENRIKRS
jgi:NADH:ubiquinone oxidoreductase subunit F (NADH-binding)